MVTIKQNNFEIHFRLDMVLQVKELLQNTKRHNSQFEVINLPGRSLIIVVIQDVVNDA